MKQISPEKRHPVSTLARQEGTSWAMEAKITLTATFILKFGLCGQIYLALLALKITKPEFC